MIIGVVFAIFIPLIIVSTTRSASLTNQVQQEIAFTLGQQIVDKAETIFYLGEPSKSQMRIRMPEGVKSIDLRNRELVFIVAAIAGETEIVVPSTINISGTIPTTSGIHTITLESRGSYVQIS